MVGKDHLGESCPKTLREWQVRYDLTQMRQQYLMTCPTLKSALSVVCVHLKGPDPSCSLSLMKCVVPITKNMNIHSKYVTWAQPTGFGTWGLHSEICYASTDSRIHHLSKMALNLPDPVSQLCFHWRICTLQSIRPRGSIPNLQFTRSWVCGLTWDTWSLWVCLISSDL